MPASASILRKKNKAGIKKEPAMIDNVKVSETFIGPKIIVKTDPKSNAKVINFPFDFPDYEKGMVIICRLTNDEWVPSNDIESVIIKFK